MSIAKVVNADGYPDVAMRTFVTVAAVTDPQFSIPDGLIVAVVREWLECRGDPPHACHGYVEARHIPGGSDFAAGTLMPVKPGDGSDAAVWNRLDAGADVADVTGNANVACVIPSGTELCLVDRWIEISIEGNQGFIKARHMPHVPDAARIPAAAAAAAAAAEAAPMDNAPADNAAPEAPAQAAPAPSPDETATAAAAAKACDICMDVQDSGVTCPGGQHFICKSCTSAFLSAFCTAEWEEQSKAKGRVLCPMKDSDEPFADASLVSMVPQEVFDKYLGVRIAVVEKMVHDKLQSDMQTKIDELKDKLATAEGSAEQLEIDKRRLHIIENIFTLKCPRCKLAFLDYDGCAAVTCAGCGCGFCSYCLEDCGKDAHQHFYSSNSKCPKEKGPIFPNGDEWQTYQAKRKGHLLAAYLAKVPEELQGKLLAAIALEAKAIGIALPSNAALGLAEEDVTFCISVPRRVRAFLANRSAAVKGVKLIIPDAKAPVTAWNFWGEASSQVLETPVAKNGFPLANGKQVIVDDEWVEVVLKNGASGYLKTKHCRGRTWPKDVVTVIDAGGYKSSLVRKLALQDSGKANVECWIKDGEKVTIVRSWVECRFPEGVAGSGFILSQHIPDNDVLLCGPSQECVKAVKTVEGILGFNVRATPKGDGKGLGDGKGKGKVKGFGKGKNKGKGKGKDGGNDNGLLYD